MKKSLILISLLTTSAFANDSTGYVGTGGIEYLKNKNIAMHSEDLFISKKIGGVSKSMLPLNESIVDIKEH